jgi:hypothetical protein
MYTLFSPMQVGEKKLSKIVNKFTFLYLSMLRYSVMLINK